MKKIALYILLAGLILGLTGCVEEDFEAYETEETDTEETDEEASLIDELIEIWNEEDGEEEDEEEEEKEEESETEEAAPDEEEEDKDTASEEEPAENDKTEKEEKTEDEGTGNRVTVDIPASELSDEAIRFRTVTLDNKEVGQEIFSDYDITVVHVWGTFCGPCIAEMGDYAEFYKELPDNVNLIGIVCDVYDGINNNVKEAKNILNDAGAEFTNLRTSDDIYDLTASLQYVPSSFFVDGEGHIIGKILDGADFKDTRKVLDGYLK
ncbi:MAG: TlpA family protein disulfide reductase [Lachnospiraceae bacterium]|nr:TlpA family protein disulfide reductase [Lachnospiraceae bacterium]